MAGRALDVFLTVDTEFSPRALRSGVCSVDEIVARDIDGRTGDGEYGLRYQLDVLDEFGLKAAFFVEALSASSAETGPGPLHRIVETVLSRGHDVQLHAHTEWMADRKERAKPGRAGDRLYELPLEAQIDYVGRAKENLLRAGVKAVRAFRAGHYAADLSTLKAAAANGIPIDTSYNVGWLPEDTDLPVSPPLTQPIRLGGVLEIPITSFRDRPSHWRHVQLCAVSEREMERALFRARDAGWRTFVIISHSFELLRRSSDFGHPGEKADLVIARFRKLCRFLAERKDAFRVRTFDGLDPAEYPDAPQPGALTSPLALTVLRMAEQLTGIAF